MNKLFYLSLSLWSFTVLSEPMPLVKCQFDGKVVSESKKEDKAIIKVKITSLLSNSIPQLDCGVEINKIYDVNHPGKKKFKTGEMIKISSEYDGSTSCVPDEKGNFEKPRPAELKLE